MSTKVSVQRFARQERRRQVGRLTTTLCAALLMSCSVYDSSLLSGRQALPNGVGAGGNSPEPEAGESGVTSTNGGSELGGAPAGTGDAGQPNGEPTPGGDSSDAGATETEVIVTAGGPNAGGTAGVIGTSGGASGSSPTRGGAGGSSPTNGGAVGMGNAGAAGSGVTLRELGQGKKATTSSQETGNTPAKGNDNNTATRWCAVDGTWPQWWRVDLGSVYHLAQVIIRFEHPDRKYYYTLETSVDDAVYAQQAIVNGVGTVQTVDLTTNPSVRYFRITVTNAIAGVDKNGVVYPTWASFWEIALMGN